MDNANTNSGCHFFILETRFSEEYILQLIEIIRLRKYIKLK